MTGRDVEHAQVAVELPAQVTRDGDVEAARVVHGGNDDFRRRAHPSVVPVIERESPRLALERHRDDPAGDGARVRARERAHHRPADVAGGVEEVRVPIGPRLQVGVGQVGDEVARVRRVAQAELGEERRAAKTTDVGENRREHRRAEQLVADVLDERRATWHLVTTSSSCAVRGAVVRAVAGGALHVVQYPAVVVVGEHAAVPVHRPARNRVEPGAGAASIEDDAPRHRLVEDQRFVVDVPDRLAERVVQRLKVHPPRHPGQQQRRAGVDVARPWFVDELVAEHVDVVFEHGR